MSLRDKNEKVMCPIHPYREMEEHPSFNLTYFVCPICRSSEEYEKRRKEEQESNKDSKDDQNSDEYSNPDSWFSSSVGGPSYFARNFSDL